jgi:hypothetical protein
LISGTSFDGSPPKVHKFISWRVYEQFPGDQCAPNLATDIITSCDESVIILDQETQTKQLNRASFGITQVRGR